MPKRYEPSEDMKERLLNSFTYHAPFGDQVDRYEYIRAAGLSLADIITSLTPYSREQSLAITALEECVMRANQAIALNEQPELAPAESPPTEPQS